MLYNKHLRAAFDKATGQMVQLNMAGKEISVIMAVSCMIITAGLRMTCLRKLLTDWMQPVRVR